MKLNDKIIDIEGKAVVIGTTKRRNENKDKNNKESDKDEKWFR